MRIGIDFDNTIVSYDVLFHRVAVDQGAVPADLPQSKLAVRDYLRADGREPVWTEMQGEVYGARMLEADPFPGVVDFFAWAGARGIALNIVSHKTRHPYLGPQYDLHAIARDWIRTHLVRDGQRLIADDAVFFELTKDDKLARVGSCGCDYFIDDLPEILTAPAFPPNTVPVLFAPGGGTTGEIAATMDHWDAVRAYVEAL
jgi:hypothetical protein